MLAKYLTSAAVAAALIIPGGALAATKNSTVTLKLQVNPIIMLFVTDDENDDGTSGAGATQQVSVTDQSGTTLNNDLGTGEDGTNAANDDFRAEFWVVSNTIFDISIEPEVAGDIYTEGTTKYTKFFGEGTGTNWLAGELFLDKDLSDPGTDTTTADADDAQVDEQDEARGIRKYGVGAIFDITKWGDASGLNTERTGVATDPNGGETFAPDDTYTQDVVVRVTNS